MELKYIQPFWNCSKHIQSICTTRCGGYSSNQYESFNLGLHVGDDANVVLQNRELLKKCLGLDNIIFLNQIHSTFVHVVTKNSLDQNVNADALVTREQNLALAIMTADCLPVMLTNKSGNVIGNAHAGWKGLCEGILENTVWQMSCDPLNIIAYLGPCIDLYSFEIGEEVRDRFLQHDQNCYDCFLPLKNEGKFLANLPMIARKRLVRLGVPNSQIYGGFWSTFSQKNLFFSYRREKITGRMASLIWISN